MNKMRDIQFDFVSKVLVKIKAAVNGRVKYKYFDQLDAVIFTVYFKDFQFEFPIKDIQTNILNGVTTDEIIDRFKKEYRSSILNAFFKK